MAANFFLKIGDISGEATQSGFDGQIEVLNYNWAVSQPGGFSYAGGGGVAQANIHDLTISFRMCSASPKFMEACASGKHFDDAVLTCLRAAGDQAEKYLEITLTDVMIASYQTGAGGDEFPVETIGLNFAQIKEEYFKQNDQGVAESAGSGQWNQLTSSTS
ncbi:type VI secretion system receptor/chaperone Hcp [soil metagenome]